MAETRRTYKEIESRSRGIEGRCLCSFLGVRYKQDRVSKQEIKENWNWRNNIKSQKWRYMGCTEVGTTWKEIWKTESIDRRLALQYTSQWRGVVTVLYVEVNKKSKASIFTHQKLLFSQFSNRPSVLVTTEWGHMLIQQKRLTTSRILKKSFCAQRL